MRDIPEQYAEIIEKHKQRAIEAIRAQQRAGEAINDVVSLMDLGENETVDIDRMVIIEEDEDAPAEPEE